VNGPLTQSGAKGVITAALLSDSASNLYGVFSDGKYGADAVGELLPGSGGWVLTELWESKHP